MSIKYTDENEIQEAFIHYRQAGFPYPVLHNHDIIHLFRKLKKAKAKINKARPTLFNTDKETIEVQPIGEIVISNFFHPHIWESHAVNMRSAVQSYHIDKSLQKVMRLCLKFNGHIDDKGVLLFLRTVNGTQVCSNYRPTAAKAIYDYYRPKNVLDMSAGYGGRLLGFIASKCKGHYTGVDPSNKSCRGNLAIARHFKKQRRVTIIQSPFEDVDLQGLKVDLAFTSTPYFAKEIYEEKNKMQSRERYPEYKAWLKGFMKPLVRKTRKALTKKGIMAININDVKIKNVTYPLVKDTVKIAEQNGFKLVNQIEMVFSSFGKNLEKRKTEPILIFRKKKK